METKDYFNHWEELPEPVKRIIGTLKDECTYDELKDAQKSLESLGWYFDFDLSGVPYGLRPIECFDVIVETNSYTGEIVYILRAMTKDKTKITTYHPSIREDNYDTFVKHKEILISRGFVNMGEHQTETI